MIKELGPGFRLTLALTMLTGLLYPGVMTGISEVDFSQAGQRQPGDGERQSRRLKPHRPIVCEARIFSSAAFGCRQRLRRDCQRRLEPGPHQRQTAPRNDQNG